MHPTQQPQDQRNLIIAVVLSAILLLAWQVFVEIPRREKIAAWQAANPPATAAATTATAPKPGDAPAQTREARLAASPRIVIRSSTVDGTLSLKGLRFDDLHLAKYRETIDPTSPEVTLLSPTGDDKTQFMQLGWLSSGNGATRVPDENTLWQADNHMLTPEKPVTFRWNNGEGVTFIVTLSMDQQYMFRFTQRVENASGKTVMLAPYAFVNRALVEHPFSPISHEGPLGVLEGALVEHGYEDIKEKAETASGDKGGWLGITDKYWLTALIPGEGFKATFSHYQSKGHDRYQAEYTTPMQEITSGSNLSHELRFFAGAKELATLDAYAEGDANNAPIKLFDRAVDFGVLYFLTKPLFQLLTYFYALVGNFGIAIIMLTFAVKLAMYPLANKGFRATSKMRSHQPEMLEIRDRYKNDKMKMQQEMIALYKRNKINPAAGCLPILIQIPVFFALYKVLFVTIEMRHAPFYGWLRDLSEKDLSNVFELFGLLPWDAPNWLHIGILPLLMGFTMWLQMKQQPKPTDPVQAQVIGLMPYFLTIVLAPMPAGLVLYWTVSNVLSIIQQWVISKRVEAEERAGIVK